MSASSPKLYLIASWLATALGPVALGLVLALVLALALVTVLVNQTLDQATDLAAVGLTLVASVETGPPGAIELVAPGVLDVVGEDGATEHHIEGPLAHLDTGDGGESDDEPEAIDVDELVLAVDDDHLEAGLVLPATAGVGRGEGEDTGLGVNEERVAAQGVTALGDQLTVVGANADVELHIPIDVVGEVIAVADDALEGVADVGVDVVPGAAHLRAQVAAQRGQVKALLLAVVPPGSVHRLTGVAVIEIEQASVVIEGEPAERLEGEASGLGMHTGAATTGAFDDHAGEVIPHSFSSLFSKFWFRIFVFVMYARTETGAKPAR